MLDEIMEDGKNLRLKTGAKLIKKIQIEEKKSRNLVAIGFNYKLTNKTGHMFQHYARHVHPHHKS